MSTPDMKTTFQSLYSHGFLRVSACTPGVDVARPSFNVQQTLTLASAASEQKVALALFPELGLSAYSNEDLFHQDALLDAVDSAISQIVHASRELLPVVIVGAPIRAEGKLFNCALAIYRGKLLGVIPKTYLPNYREFYEKRQFASAQHAGLNTITVCNESVMFGNDLIFEAANLAGFTFHIEICEDLWVPIPPSTYAALSGATLLANLSASDITIGKAEYRKLLCASQSAKCMAAYLYSAAGPGESTTDLAWDGHALIYENGDLLAESTRFPQQPGLITADVDLDRLRQDRMRMTSFNDCAATHREGVSLMRRVTFEFENVQAGQRASHLFRLANMHQALVVGTSDLSELALGYTTYGVGDHMSHYSVNASVPKTLIQHLIRWLIKTQHCDPRTRTVLERIVRTRISPELVPGANSEPAQRAEAVVGPYELQDFHLYYFSRFGYRPSKVAFLAWNAWGDRRRGAWPDTVPIDQQREYDLATLRKWLEVFIVRFFEFSQFKRSAMPNGPKVGSGGSLSPRSDWRAPSDARADVWLEELRERCPL